MQPVMQPHILGAGIMSSLLTGMKSVTQNSRHDFFGNLYNLCRNTYTNLAPNLINVQTLASHLLFILAISICD